MKRILLGISCLVALDAHAQVYGKTALMSAADYNDLYSVEKLIQAGHNVNATDSNNNTAYCYAYAKKNLNVAKTLERFGADTRRRCNISGQIFVTRSLSAPYYNESSTKYAAKSGSIRFQSGFFSASKPYLLAGLGVAGVAAAAGGGGGGSEGSSVAMAGDPPARSTDVDPSAFETAEFFGNAAAAGLSEATDSEFLDVINAQYAYARGYDGSGIKIAILDTGIDIDHEEFDDLGKINADLTNTDMQSSDSNPDHEDADNDHGTMVASIAAGAKDDSTMHGVAYGAEIIPYRMGDGSGGIGPYTYSSIIDAIGKGATVINMSYGVSADDTYNASTAISSWLLSSYADGSSSNMTTLENAVTTNEVILVRAAGNEDYSQPSLGNALPLQYTNFDGYFVTAIALNEDGTKIVSTEDTYWGSNKCGVAKNYCLGAVGTSQVAAADGGGYSYGGGTSSAAPTIAGAVAVVQDAFGLSAEKTLNILFQTATDLGVAGVDDVYGHGLLNLDLATAPGANLLAPSSSGSISFNNTGITTSGAMAVLKAPNFKIEDELYRTFEVEGNSLLAEKDENIDLQERDKTFAKEKKIITKKLESGLTTSFVMSNEYSSTALDNFDYMSLAAEVKGFDVSFGFTNNPGQSLENTVRSVNLIDENALANPYLGLAENGFVASSNYQLSDDLTFQTNVFFGDIEDRNNNNLGKSTSALAKLIYNVNDDSQISLESGFLQENETVLGSKFTGAFALADDNYTYFTGLTAKTVLTSKFDLFANAYIGVTKADTVSNSLVSDVSNIVSHSAAIGGQYNFTNKKTAGLILSQPLKVNSGSISYDYLSGGNIDKGYQYTNESQSLAPSATQLDIQAFYKQEFEKGDKLNFGLLHSINADSIKGEDDTSLLVKYRSKF